MTATSHNTEGFSDFLKRREAISSEYINGAATGLLSISAHTDPVTFFPPNGVVVQGAKEVNQANEKGAESFAHGTRSWFEILNSGSDGTVGYWSGYQHSEVKLAGKEGAVPMKPRVTELFRKRDDG